MKAFALAIFIPLFFCSGCDLRKREEALQKKVIALNQREQELNLKADSLQIKELDLKQREQNLDSVVQKDTASFYNPAVIGTWLVKMTCTETSCTGSAIGDVKTEQWIISYEGDAVITRAMSGNKLVRVYSGTATDNDVQLAESAKNLSTLDTKILVTLNIIDTKNIEGIREITRKDNCKVVYNLQMKKEQ